MCFSLRCGIREKPRKSSLLRSFEPLHAGFVCQKTSCCLLSSTVPCRKAEKRFTASDVEYSVLKALEPALQAREGTVYSFADWTMAGSGIVVVLANGQEFRMEIVEAV